MQPIKTSHGIAILTTCFLLTLLSINWASKKIDIAVSISPGSQTAATLSGSGSGLVAYWKLDEMSGTTVQDTLGGADGVLMNETGWGVGRINGALLFTGIVNQYVDLMDKDLMQGVNQFTLSFWIKPDEATSVSNRGLVCATGAAGKSTFCIYISRSGVSRKMFFNASTVDTLNKVTKVSTFSDGDFTNVDWTHVAAIYDGTKLKLYLNGVLQQVQPALSGKTVNTGGLILNLSNVYGERGYYKGLMDEIAVYHRALSTEEIQDLMAHGVPTSLDNVAPSVSLTEPIANTLVNGNESAPTEIMITNLSDTTLPPAPTGLVAIQQSSLPALSTSFKIGDRVVTTMTIGTRLAASMSSPTSSYHILSPGQLATVIDGPVMADGFMWWKIDPAYQSIRDGWVKEDLLQFRLSKPVQLDCAATTFSFGVFSDNYSGQEGFMRRAFNEMLMLDPNIRFMAGGGDTPTWQRIRTYVNSELNDSLSCGASEFPFFGASGNHDAEVQSNMDWLAANWAAGWEINAAESKLAKQLPGVINFRRGPLQVLTETASVAVDPGTIYSFDYKNTHIVFINNYEQDVIGDRIAGAWDVNGPGVFDPATSQIDWLKEDLELNKKPFIFIFGHVAAVTPQYDLNNGPAGWSEHNSPFHTVELTKLMADYNVTAYFHGHDHVTSRMLLNRNSVTGNMSTVPYSKMNFEQKNDTNRPYGTVAPNLQGTGTFWQIDAGRAYSGTGNYVITKVSDTAVTFEVYSFATVTSTYVYDGAPSSVPGETILWDTWSVPLSAKPSRPPDTESPTVPAYLTSTPRSEFQIDLSWTASTDNVNVIGYGIYRNGIAVGSTASNVFNDKNLLPQTTYTYTVEAFDISGNKSAKSLPAIAKTLPVPSTAFIFGNRIFTRRALSVRQSSVSTGTLAGTQTAGALGTVFAGPVYEEPGQWWWRVDFDTMPDGWVLEADIQKSLVAPLNATVYVDTRLASDCTTYLPATRSCGTGTDKAYKDLNMASGLVNPGDTVLIREATIMSRFIPQRSGSNGLPITFKNYANETVIITDPTTRVIPGIEMTNRHYLVIDGLRVDNVWAWGQILDSSHNIFKNNTFIRAKDSGSRGALRFINSNFNKVLNNRFEDGNDNLYFEHSMNNLIEGNTFIKARHTLLVLACSSNNVVRANTFHNDLEKAGETFDCAGEVETLYDDTLQTRRLDSTKFNIWEKNIFQYTPSDPNGNGPFNHIQYAGQNGVLRQNIFYDSTGIGLGMASYADEAFNNRSNRVYNNVFYNNVGSGIEVISSTNAAQSSDNIFKNNILYQNKPMQLRWADNTLGGSQVTHRIAANFTMLGNNIFNQIPGDAEVIYIQGTRRSLASVESLYPMLYMNNMEVEPQFVNATSHDFNLKSTSPMIDKGMALTKTISAGSGTKMPVLDAAYFYDGYKIDGEVGDEIQLEGQTATARIVRVDRAIYYNPLNPEASVPQDFSPNTIYLDKTLTWSANQGVMLKYNGAKMDLGALEYGVLDTDTTQTLSIASSTTQTSATITWTTNLPSSTRILYGLTAPNPGGQGGYGNTTTEKDTNPRVTSHSETITGLTPGQVYHYKIISTLASGSSVESTDLTFTTAPDNIDRQAPTITILGTSTEVPEGTTSTTLKLTTNEPSTCKWGRNTNAINNNFTETSPNNHETLNPKVTGLQNGANIIHVSCQDTSPLKNQAATEVTITVTPPISNDNDNDRVPNANDKCRDTPPGKSVNIHGCPKPLINDKFTKYTDFTNIDLLRVTTAIELENDNGKVVFKVPPTPYSLIKGEEPVDISSNITIDRGSITLENLPELNRPAEIILHNLTLINPKIIKDRTTCPTTICTNVSYTDGTLTFDVTGFSTYMAIEDNNPSGTRTITVTKLGSGSGTVTATGISCGDDCTETLANNTSITLTATPSSNSTFTSFSEGYCSNQPTGTSNTCDVLLTGDSTIIATFTLIPIDLCTNITGVQETTPAGMINTNSICTTPSSGGGGRSRQTTITITPVLPTIALTPIVLSLRHTQTSLYIKALQQTLNLKGYTVAYSGAGSRGQETSYFGPATLSALKKYQCAVLLRCSGTSYGVADTETFLKLGIPLPTILPTTQPITPPQTTYIWTRNLTLNSTGADVKALQIYLNTQGYTVSTTGAGSKGQETSYFGPATQRAVIKFQIANNITPAVGFFGPVTRSRLR